MAYNCDQTISRLSMKIAKYRDAVRWRRLDHEPPTHCGPILIRFKFKDDPYYDFRVINNGTAIHTVVNDKRYTHDIEYVDWLPVPA